MFALFLLVREKILSSPVAHKQKRKSLFLTLQKWLQEGVSPMIARLTALIIILTSLFIGIYWATRPLPPTDQSIKLSQVKKNSSSKLMEQSAPPKQPFSLLMIGVDQRKGDPGRTDALILFTINPRLQTIKVVHIPRDQKQNLSYHLSV